MLRFSIVCPCIFRSCDCPWEDLMLWSCSVDCLVTVYPLSMLCIYIVFQLCVYGIFVIYPFTILYQSVAYCFSTVFRQRAKCCSSFLSFLLDVMDVRGYISLGILLQSPRLTQPPGNKTRAAACSLVCSTCHMLSHEFPGRSIHWLSVNESVFSVAR